VTTKERANDVPIAQAGGPTKEREAGGFQQMLFGALSRRSLAPGNPFTRGTQPKQVDASAVEPIISERDQQTGRGATADWWSGSKTGGVRLLARGVPGRAPGKTGASSFQRYRRVIEPQQCDSIVERHKTLPHRCSRKAPLGYTKCTQHGLGKRSRGRLVELLPEDVPVLACDK
jgi:hypothetical protein